MPQLRAPFGGLGLPEKVSFEVLVFLRICAALRCNRPSLHISNPLQLRAEQAPHSPLTSLDQSSVRAVTYASCNPWLTTNYL
jgi:hypothetical protein